MTTASTKFKLKAGSSHKVTKQKKDEKHKQFAGNLHEGQGYADCRKTQATQAYRKLLQKERRSLAQGSKRTQQIYSEDTESGPSSKQPQKETKRPGNQKSMYRKAENTWKRKKEEVDIQKQASATQRKERDAARQKYEQNKKAAHKKLSKRNYKGQPIMSGQMDLLLERIAKNRRKK